MRRVLGAFFAPSGRGRSDPQPRQALCFLRSLKRPRGLPFAGFHGRKPRGNHRAERPEALSPHGSVGRELHAPKSIHAYKFDSSFPLPRGGVWRRLKNHTEVRAALRVRPEERKHTPHLQLALQANLRSILRNFQGFRPLLETIGLSVRAGNGDHQTQRNPAASATRGSFEIRRDGSHSPWFQFRPIIRPGYSS
jgi:hypothetical protein